METKNNGNNLEYEGGAKREAKDDKIRYDLIPLAQFKRLCELYTRGAKIYGADNYLKGYLDDEYIDKMRQASWRHFFQFMNGETDEDHMAAVVFNLFGFEELKRLKSEHVKRILETKE